MPASQLMVCSGNGCPAGEPSTFSLQLCPCLPWFSRVLIGYCSPVWHSPPCLGICQWVLLPGPARLTLNSSGEHYNLAQPGRHPIPAVLCTGMCCDQLWPYPHSVLVLRFTSGWCALVQPNLPPAYGKYMLLGTFPWSGSGMHLIVVLALTCQDCVLSE